MRLSADSRLKQVREGRGSGRFLPMTRLVLLQRANDGANRLRRIDHLEVATAEFD